MHTISNSSFHAEDKLWCFPLIAYDRVIADLKTIDARRYQLQEIPAGALHILSIPNPPYHWAFSFHLFLFYLLIPFPLLRPLCFGHPSLSLLSFFCMHPCCASPFFTECILIVRHLFCLHSDNFDQSRLPEAMWSALMPFQREGVRYAVRHGGRVLFGDEMGLGELVVFLLVVVLLVSVSAHFSVRSVVPFYIAGKTVQALAVCRYYKSDWPVLVITPSALRFNWERYASFDNALFCTVFDCY
jgi:hypothetical protein